jgi:antitoxin VapB
MPISIKDPETDQLARDLADVTGETLTEAIRIALAERLERERSREGTNGVAGAVRRIQERIKLLPVLDER